jgi:adenylate cyclase
VLVYGAVTVYRYSLEQRQKRELRRLFSRYVSEEVVADILRQSDAQALGGKRLELTVLFSDIRGFTTLSQELSPERVVAILNQYLTAMTEVIFQNRGTVDKFLGDGVMVLFGAPLTCPDAPVRAVNTAIQMQERLEELGANWEREGVGPLRIGIGIHTGDAIVGNIGSPRRMSYTAIGDTVNIASRLQDLTKTFDSSIIFSEAVYRCIKEQAAVKPLGPVILKGRDEPINIYGIVVQPPK